MPTFAPPKRGKTRFVPVGGELLRSIDAYTEEFEPVMVKPTQPPRGPVWQPQTFNSDIWVPAFEAAGLEHVKQWDGMHALRHYYASAMLEQGVSIKALAEYLGHKDPACTLKVYTHPDALQP